MFGLPLRENHRSVPSYLRGSTSLGWLYIARYRGVRARMNRLIVDSQGFRSSLHRNHRVRGIAASPRRYGPVGDQNRDCHSLEGQEHVDDRCCARRMNAAGNNNRSHQCWPLSFTLRAPSALTFPCSRICEWWYSSEDGQETVIQRIDMLTRYLTHERTRASDTTWCLVLLVSLCTKQIRLWMSWTSNTSCLVRSPILLTLVLRYRSPIDRYVKNQRVDGCFCTRK